MPSTFKRIARKAALLGAIISLVGVMVALAASGGLDSTFGIGGIQMTSFPPGNWYDVILAVARQSDGKIVAVGAHWDPANDEADTFDWALARYKTDGSLDGTFSGDGEQLTDFGRMDMAYGIAIQSNGRIVVGGATWSTSSDAAFARYDTFGNLDPTFGVGGKRVIDFAGGDNGVLKGLAIRSDGKIVAAGWMTNASGDSDFAVYRLNPDGSPNSAFSGDGRASFGFGFGRQDSAEDLVKQGSKIVVVGSTCDSTYRICDFALARLNANGTLDKTFGKNGKVRTNFGADERARAAALQPDGKIVVVGWKRGGSNFYMALARYNTNGSLDTTFNGTGKKVIRFGTSAGANDVLVQANGKIVVAGWGDNGTTPDFAMARLKPGGRLDSTFNGNGKVMIDIGQDDMGYGLVRQTNGKYVIGGIMYLPGSSAFALARVLP